MYDKRKKEKYMKKKAMSIILAAMMTITPMSVSAQEVFITESTPAVETGTELEAGTSSAEKKYQGFTYIEEKMVQLLLRIIVEMQ